MKKIIISAFALAVAALFVYADSASVNTSSGEIKPAILSQQVHSWTGAVSVLSNQMYVYARDTRSLTNIVAHFTSFNSAVSSNRLGHINFTTNTMQ